LLVDGDVLVPAAQGAQQVAIVVRAERLEAEGCN